MLTFTRRSGESFLLLPSASLNPDMTVAELFASRPVRIEIAELHGRQVRLRVDAPREIAILRSEIWVLSQLRGLSRPSPPAPR